MDLFVSLWRFWMKFTVKVVLIKILNIQYFNWLTSTKFSWYAFLSCYLTFCQKEFKGNVFVFFLLLFGKITQKKLTPLGQFVMKFILFCVTLDLSDYQICFRFPYRENPDCMKNTLFKWIYLTWLFKMVPEKYCRPATLFPINFVAFFPLCHNKTLDIFG